MNVNIQIYTKDDATMTKGLAILSMLILHLFCRKGSAVLGSPLFWLNEDTPLVYYFGFFSGICVPLYSLCIGYAQQLFIENRTASWKANVIRINRLMINYWIVLFVFCTLGLIFDPYGNCPGTILDFLKSIVLLHSYNGSWWFLKTYILLLLIPSTIMMFPVKKLSPKLGLFCCLLFQIGWYLLSRFQIIPLLPNSMKILSFIWTELANLISILPYILAGAFLCKGKIVHLAINYYNEFIPKKFRKILLLFCSLFLFIITSILHKALLVSIVSVIVFLLFNMWKKGNTTKKIFLFLGNHSTNIWLTHMFFYAYIFKGLVEFAQFPLAMFLLLLTLCIITSYIIKKIELFIYSHITVR